MLKILIILPYYDRPNLVKNALNSILKSTYDNWELAFIDDGSKNAGKPVVEEILSNHLDKIKFYNSNMSSADKNKHGCMLGKYINLAIENSDADIGIILCDDDELHIHYLSSLNNFFMKNDSMSCYSHVHIYNPILEKSENVNNVVGNLNKYSHPIACSCVVDASQVAWRLSVNKELGCWFDYPRSKDHDSAFFKQLYDKTGATPFSGFISQYKAIHSLQLGNVKYVSCTDMTGDHEFNVRRELNFLMQESIKKIDNFIDSGDFNEASILAEQCFKVDAKNSEIIFRLGIINFCLGNKENAIKYLLDSVQYSDNEGNREYALNLIEKIKHG